MNGIATAVLIAAILLFLIGIAVFRRGKHKDIGTDKKTTPTADESATITSDAPISAEHTEVSPAQSAEEAAAQAEADAIRAEDVESLADALKKVLIQTQGPKPEMDADHPSAKLLAANRVLVVPGQGMVDAKAHWLAGQLVSYLQKRGVSVAYMLHEQAGHVQGEVEALLLETGVSEDTLLRWTTESTMDDALCDVCLIIGANDIVNPAGISAADDAPLFGLHPVDVELADHLILCALDASPGLSGTHNLLFDRTLGMSLLLGDAKESLQALVDGFEG